MKILLILSRNILEKGNPRNESLLTRINYLSKLAKVDVMMPNINNTFQASNIDVYYYKSPGTFGIVLRCFYNLLFFRPLQYNFSKPILDNKSMYPIDETYDLVIVDTIRVIGLLKKIKTKVSMLDADDIFSIRYSNQSSNNHKSSLLNAYENRTNSFVLKIIKSLSAFILIYEAKSFEMMEKKYLELFNYVLLISEKEKKILEYLISQTKNIDKNTIISIPHFSKNLLCKSDYFEYKKPKIANSAFMVGNFKYPPSLRSFEVTVNEILPLILKKNRTFELHIFGPGLDFKKYEHIKQIKYHGFVDDLKSEISNFCLNISFIPYGSGVKTKIVESMAWGKPVITNSIGAEGLNITNGIHMIIEDNLFTFSSKVNQLLYDHKMQEKLASEAFNLFLKNFSYQVVSKKWKTFIKGC
ncbi:MAG: glycosyltransferase [Methylophilaceae bacterium]